MMTELEIYNEMANIILYLLKLKRLSSPIDPNDSYAYTIEQLYKVIDDTINNLPINVITLNQFVKLVKDAHRFKPIQNNSISIYKHFNNEILFSCSDNFGMKTMIIFDDKEIKTIGSTYITYPYSEEYDHVIRNGLTLYFKRCVDLVFRNKKRK